MKRIFITLLSLFLFSCSLQYSVKTEEDKYSGSTKTYEENNRVQGFSGSVYLNLSKQVKEDSELVFIRFDYRDANWIYVEKNEGIQILLKNGEVVKLSSVEMPSRNVESGGDYVGVSESGVLMLDKNTLKTLLSNPIESVRVYGSDSYKEYGNGTSQLQQRWKEFSNTHLTDFLN